MYCIYVPGHGESCVNDVLNKKNVLASQSADIAVIYLDVSSAASTFIRLHSTVKVSKNADQYNVQKLVWVADLYLIKSNVNGMYFSLASEER